MGKKNKLPFVSVCTPTFNRRPFIPFIIKCFENQTYPREKMEWIIVDDGTDKIEDLVAHLPYVKYIRYEEKLTLGKKRNIMNELSKGDIIVYMDDDDYYPPERVKHAVEKLRESKALCAGSSEMFIYFKHIQKMYKFGPYGPKHSTAATFAFKRQLLSQTKFNEEACLAEEKFFLKNYTIPFVQLDSMKTILVFSHNQNSFDKKELLKQLPNPYIHESHLQPSDFVKEVDILSFFMKDIDSLLSQYKLGDLEHKPDVTTQLSKMKSEREKQQMEAIEKQKNENKLFSEMANILSVNSMNKEKEIIHSVPYQLLLKENEKLKEQVEYLQKKMRELFEQKRNELKPKETN